MNNDTDHAGSAAVTKPELDALQVKLQQRILASDGGTANQWNHHWNLVGYDSKLHKDASDAITALVAECDALQQKVQGYYNEASEGWTKFRAAEQERDAYKDLAKLNEMKIISCGVAATNPDPGLTRTGAYAAKWDSAQAEHVRKLREERDALAKTVADLGADAERYQFVRMNRLWIKANSVALNAMSAFEFDSAIDAARGER